MAVRLSAVRRGSALRALTATLLASMACAAPIAHAGGDGCTAGSEFEPPLCPLQLPKIARLTVTGNAIRSAALNDPAVDCRPFVLNPTLVRRYLARAKTTSDRDAHFTLDWSGCSARGDIVFADGRQGTWSIDQGRLGSLAIGSAPALTLYCRGCGFRPFNPD